MRNNDCIHRFSDWKKVKKPVLDFESLNDDRAYVGICFQRKCKTCGLVDTKFEKINKKGNNKKLSLSYKTKNKEE